MTQSTYDMFNYRLSELYNEHIINLGAFNTSKKNKESIFQYNEILLHKVLTNMKFNLMRCNWMNNFIVRPSIIDIFPISTGITLGDYPAIRENTYSYWSNLTTGQKIEYCAKQNVYIEDYHLDMLRNIEGRKK
jgi:hypothetical protein